MGEGSKEFSKSIGADRITGFMLQHLDVLRPVSLPALDRLAAASFARSYRKGAEIDWNTREGTAVVFGVLAGAVQIGFRSFEGREQHALHIRAGQVFYEIGKGHLRGLDLSIAQVNVTPTVLCQLPHRAFTEAVIERPEAAARYIEQQKAWLDVFSGLLADRLHGTKTRIQRTLERDARSIDEVTVKYTHEDIARQAGTDRARVTKVLGTLVGEGAVEVDEHHHIVRIHPERLIDEE